jgi:thiol-disulfide isomerase/thioredoxin
MNWTRTLFCLMIFAMSAPFAAAQSPTDSVRIQPVKYSGLADVIHQNRGKVILVDFWGDFCIPCKKGFPHVVDLHKKYAQEGLIVISVSLDPIDDPSTSQANALRFLKKMGADFINLYLEEPPEVWQKKLGITGPPCYYVFNRAGQWTKFEPQENELVYPAIEKCIVERLRAK